MNTASAITLVAVDCAYPQLAAAALARSARALPAARTLLLTDRAITHQHLWAFLQRIDVICLPIAAEKAPSLRVFEVVKDRVTVGDEFPQPLVCTRKLQIATLVTRI